MTCLRIYKEAELRFEHQTWGIFSGPSWGECAVWHPGDRVKEEGKKAVSHRRVAPLRCL